MNCHQICPKSTKVLIENIVKAVLKDTISQDCKCRNCCKLTNEVIVLSDDEEITTLLNDKKPAINEELVTRSEEDVGNNSNNVEQLSRPSLMSLSEAPLLSEPIMENDFFRRVNKNGMERLAKYHQDLCAVVDCYDSDGEGSAFIRQPLAGRYPDVGCSGDPIPCKTVHSAGPEVVVVSDSDTSTEDTQVMLPKRRKIQKHNRVRQLSSKLAEQRPARMAATKARENMSRHRYRQLHSINDRLLKGTLDIQYYEPQMNIKRELVPLEDEFANYIGTNGAQNLKITLGNVHYCLFESIRDYRQDGNIGVPQNGTEMLNLIHNSLLKNSWLENSVHCKLLEENYNVDDINLCTETKIFVLTVDLESDLRDVFFLEIQKEFDQIFEDVKTYLKLNKSYFEIFNILLEKYKKAVENDDGRERLDLRAIRDVLLSLVNEDNRYNDFLNALSTLYLKFEFEAQNSPMKTEEGQAAGNTLSRRGHCVLVLTFTPDEINISCSSFTKVILKMRQTNPNLQAVKLKDFPFFKIIRPIFEKFKTKRNSQSMFFTQNNIHMYEILNTQNIILPHPYEAEIFAYYFLTKYLILISTAYHIYKNILPRDINGFVFSIFNAGYEAINNNILGKLGILQFLE